MFDLLNLVEIFVAWRKTHKGFGSEELNKGLMVDELFPIEYSLTQYYHNKNWRRLFSD
jgi:hypothetical protein